MILTSVFFNLFIWITCYTVYRYQKPIMYNFHYIYIYIYDIYSDIWSVGVTCYELLFGEKKNINELSYVTKFGGDYLLTPKETNLSENCCDFLNKCFITNDEHRPNAQQLLNHKWFIDNNNNNNERLKVLEWFKSINNKKINDNDDQKQGIYKKQFDKRISFKDLKQNKLDNDEDLLFMISALIIYYAQQNVNLTPSPHRNRNLSRRISQFEANNCGYSDDDRISNIAYYASCSNQIVIQRIKNTVSHLKSQINTAQRSCIDS